MIFVQWVPDYLFPSVCAAPNWLLHLGFSLGYLFFFVFLYFYFGNRNACHQQGIVIMMFQLRLDVHEDLASSQNCHTHQDKGSGRQDQGI